MIEELLSPEGEIGARDVVDRDEQRVGGRGAERAVGERSESAAGAPGGRGRPDPELVERPKRRRFIGGVQAADLARGRRVHAAGRDRRAVAPRGPVHVASDGVAQAARRGRAGGARRGRGPQAGRPGATPRSPSCAGALERAEAELEKARKVIEVQGNVSALLGELLEPEGRAARAPSDDRADRRGAHADRRHPAGVPGAGRRRRRRSTAAGARPTPRPPRPRPAPARALSERRARGGAGRAALASGSSTARRRRCGRRCSTRAATWRRSARCTGCSAAEHGEVRERRDQLDPPALRGARAARRAAERGLVVGHHEAALGLCARNSRPRSSRAGAGRW